MRKFIHFWPVVTLLTVSACQSRPAAAKPAPLAPALQVTATPVIGVLPSTSAVVTRKPVAVPTYQGASVYTPPKIVKTVLAPYQDEKGRIFGPQEMYEKVEEGHFNVQALENPETAYIPPENMVVPPGMGNPASMPAMERAAEEAPRMPTDYIDPRDVVVTGLLGRDTNREEAERMARAASRRAVFDPDLGWLLVPLANQK